MRLAVKETETENLFETLANKSPVGLYIVQDGRFCYTNSTFQSTTGYTEDELVGRDALDLVVPEDRERVRENAIKMLKGELTSPYQFRVTHKNGSIKWVMESVSSVQYLRRRATLGDFIDITERKQVEEKVQHLNLVLRAIRNINQLIARGTDRDSLLKGACDTFVETRGYYSAWIALLDGSGKLVTAAEAGLGKSFLQIMERLKRGELMHCGRKVLEKPGVLVIKDVSSECEDCPAVKEDTGRDAMSIRLEHGGKVYGLMAVSIPPGRAAEKEEQNLFEEIAGDIAFALHDMEQEQERERVEEALQASEEMYKTVVEDAPIGIYYNDFSGTFLYGNKKAEEIVGYKVEELLGKSFFKLKLLRPEGIAKAAKLLALNKLGKATGPDLFTLNRKDGTTSIVEIRTKVSTFDGKEAVLGMVEDITERQKAERELSKTQAQLSSAVQMAHLGPWEYDAIKDLFTFNDAFYELFHTTAEEVGGYTISSAEYARRFVHPEDAHLVGEEVRKALQADDPNFSRQLDHRIIYADGKVGYISVRFFVVKDETGRTVRTYGVNQDITERKRAEEALQAEKNKLQSLIDAMEDTITIQDTEFNIIYQNEPSRIASGGDHLGEKCYRVYEGRESICEGCPVEKAFKDGKSHTSERMTTIAGKVAFWENTANPIRDAGGKIISCLEIARDITERKKQEQALQAEKNKLQSLIDAMTDALNIIDRDYNLIYQNEPAKRPFGERTGEKCYLVFEGNKKVCEGCPVEQAFKDGKSHTAERRTVTPSGEVIFWENTANPIRDAEGRIVSCLEIAKDITERKKQEQALADELTRRRLLIDKSLDGIVVLDVNARVVEANQRFADMLGYTLEEVHKLHTWDWDKNFPPEKILEMGRNVDEKGLHLETKHTRKDGSVIDVDISISGIMYGGRKLIFCIQRDVTERNRAEEALKNSEESYRELSNSITDVFFAMDEHLRYTYWNRASEILTGVRAEDAIGKSLQDIFPDTPGLRKAEKVYRAVLKTQKSRTFVNDFDIDGRYCIFEIGAYPSRGGISVFARDITERKRAEEALHQSEEKYRALFDSTVIGTVVIDAETMKVVMANQAAVKIFGLSSAEETIGASPLDFAPPEDRERILELILKELFEQDLQQTREFRMITKDGRAIWVSVTAVRIMHEGRLAGLVSLTDITGRKEMEEAINLQTAYFQQLFDNSPDAILMTDTNSKVIQTNRGFEKLFGYSNEEVKGRSLSELIIPEVYVQEASDTFQRISGGEVVRKESVRRRKDGSLVNVSVLGYPIRSNDKLVGAYGVYSDITERNRAEETIKRAAEEWRETFDSITDAISIHDRDFKVLRANKAFADIFHKKPSQIIGKHCYELHKRNKPHSGCPHKKTLATKKPAVAEFYESNLRKYRYETTSPIFDEKGKVVSTVHLTRDVTEQKQQHERLMMADRLASIGELAAGTAHELNNPLTSVIGFSQLLMEKDIPDDIREDAELIYNEAQRAANVTKSLLTFGRKHAPVKQLNQINNIVEDVLKLRAYEHKVNSIEVKRQLTPDLPEIMVDYFQMQQAFLNIIINAEYFMTEAHNKGVLTITTKKQNSSVKISIADDGPGIPEENLSRIFNPFFTTKEAGKGTGLGLSICHGIVAEHGGQIFARNQHGKGATIFIELPISSR
jgi:PAS domain S-box-containing protein